MTEKQDWATEMAMQVAAEVKRLRLAKTPKWSSKRLAEETEKLGYPIGQAVLSNFEYGRRGARLEVAELLVLAAALGVPPARLLWPNFPDGIVEYVPGFNTTSELAGKVFSGRVAADFDPEASLPIGGQMAEIDGLVEERHRLTDAIGALSITGDLDELNKEIERITTRRKEINRRIEELGGNVGEFGGSR